jgi:hypothetical protein
MRALHLQTKHISFYQRGNRIQHGSQFVSAFTRVAPCTLALSPIRDTLSEGFSYFVTSIAAPVASGWSARRVGLAPTGKHRLITAHTQLRHQGCNVLGVVRAAVVAWGLIVE